MFLYLRFKQRKIRTRVHREEGTGTRVYLCRGENRTKVYLEERTGTRAFIEERTGTRVYIEERTGRGFI